jgi:hypothetical protein
MLTGGYSLILVTLKGRMIFNHGVARSKAQ